MAQKYGPFDAILDDMFDTPYRGLFGLSKGDYLMHVWFGSYLGYPTALVLSCEEALPFGPRMELGWPPRTTVLSLEYLSLPLLTAFVDEVGQWNLGMDVNSDDF